MNKDKRIEKLEKELDKFDKIVKFLYEQEKEKESTIKDLKEKNEKLQSENNKLKKRNQTLEGLYGKHSPRWHININIAWRISPITGKQEDFRIPSDIKIDKITDLIVYDDLEWVSFKYDDDKYKNKEFKIPRSLAVQLKIIDPIDNNNQNKININDINNFENLKDNLEFREIDISLEYWQLSIDFLSFYRGSRFNTSDYIEHCKFGNRETARQCLNILIDLGLIRRVKKGVYEVLFNYE